MGDLPSHMQFRGDWRVGARRRQAHHLAWILAGLCLGITMGLLATGRLSL